LPSGEIVARVAFPEVVKGASLIELKGCGALLNNFEFSMNGIAATSSSPAVTSIAAEGRFRSFLK